MPANKLIYVSHSIRGKHGSAATVETMAENNVKAFKFGTWLRTTFPLVKFYIPGEMDGFLVEQGVDPLKIVPGLLALDCGIIQASSGMIVFAPDDYISSGMKHELEFIQTISKPVFHWCPALTLGQSEKYVAGQMAEWLEDKCV